MTSYFGDVLQQYMQQNSLRSVDFCTLLRISKSYFSKIKNGTAIPQDFAMITEMADILQLNPEETEHFFTAYKVSRFGPNYQRIESAIQVLSQAAMFPESAITEPEMLPQNGKMIQGKEFVLQAVRFVLQGQQDTERIDFQLQPNDADLVRTVQNCIMKLPEQVVCNWQLFLHQRLKSMVYAENLELLSYSMPLLLTCRMHVRYQYAKLDEFFLHQRFPFLIRNGQKLLLMTKDCMTGMYFDDPETVQFYAGAMQKSFEKSKSFCSMYQDLSVFFRDSALGKFTASACRNADLYVVEKNPCISSGFEIEEMRQHIVDDMPGKVASQYYAMLLKIIQNTASQHMFFTEDGMRELMEIEEYYEFLLGITKSIQKPIRYRILQNVIGMAQKSDYMQYHMIHHSLLSFRTLTLMNIWSDGKVLLVFHLEQENRFMILVMREKSIASALIAYFRYLRESGIALGKEESLRKMQEIFTQFADPKYR